MAFLALRNEIGGRWCPAAYASVVDVEGGEREEWLHGRWTSIRTRMIKDQGTVEKNPARQLKDSPCF